MAEHTAWSLRGRLMGMMFLQYFVQGSYLPIISVYLEEALGFSARGLGYFAAALSLGPLVSALVLGQLADRHVRLERLLAVVHLGAGLTMLLLAFQRPLLSSFLPPDAWLLTPSGQLGLVVLLGLIYSVLYTPTMMLTNALAFHHLRVQEREFPVVRMWGTIGFIVPAWLIESVLLAGKQGLELNQARGVALVVSGLSGLVMAAYCWSLLPPTPPRREQRRPFAPAALIPLFRRRDFLVLVVVSFGIAMVHQFYFTLNSPYLKAILRQAGVGEAWEGRISSVGQIAEIFVMLIMATLVARLGFKGTMSLGALAYLLRYVIFAVAAAVPWSFGAVMTLVVLGQALHGLCFGCFLAAAFMYIDRVAPPDVRSTAQSFYGTIVLSLGFALGGTVAGAVGDWFTAASVQELPRALGGLANQAGVFRMMLDGQVLYRDWVGIWLAGALLAGVCLVGFVLGFPKRQPSPSNCDH